MPDRKVICNTSPLLYLFQVGQLSLLHGLYGEIFVPLAVESELRAGAALGCLAPDVSQHAWLHVQPLLDRSLLPEVADLGPGEAEAIALALSNPGSLLILDDSLGRETSRRRGLTYTGTLGVLVRRKRRGCFRESLQLSKTSVRRPCIYPPR
jgi:predicted nucleic acid-binding protein